MKRILQLSAVAVLTVLFLYLFLRNSNLADVWRIMKSIAPQWLALGLVVNFGALVFRTLRWRTLIDNDSPPPLYATFFATTVGYMLSTVLPIRAGDVARPALLARRTDVRFSGALGSVLTERILDLYSLMGLFVFFVVHNWHSFDGDASAYGPFLVVRSGAIACSGVLAGLTALVVGIFFFRTRMRLVHGWVGRIVPQRFRSAWMHFYDAFVDSLEVAQRPLALMKVVCFTAGIWFCLTAQFWCVTMGMQKNLPFESTFFISGVTTLGLAIPTPGGVGGFHKVCQLILTTFYHFDLDTSVALAIMFHVVGTLPVLIAGLALFVHAGLRWRDVKREAAEEAREV